MMTHVITVCFCKFHKYHHARVDHHLTKGKRYYLGALSDDKERDESLINGVLDKKRKIINDLKRE